MTVRTLACINRPGKIIAEDPATGRFQVQCDYYHTTTWASGSSLYDCTAPQPKQISESWFIGTWSLFVPSDPHHEVRGGDRYLVVGPGAKAPPIIIKADGTYDWTMYDKHIRGRWRKMAPGELKYGTKPPAILLMNGAEGMDWEVWRADSTDDQNRDKITIEGMRMGLHYWGTRTGR